MKNEKVKRVILYILIIVISFMLYEISGKCKEELNETEYKKGLPGTGDEVKRVDVNVDGIGLGELEILIPERSYTNEECQRLLEDNREKIYRKLLSGSDERTLYDKDFSFFTKLEGLPFRFSFSSDHPDKVGDMGEILCIEEFDTNISIRITYEEYSSEMEINVYVKPGEKIKARVFRNLLIEKISELSDSAIVLPQSIEDKPVMYFYPEKKKNPMFILLGIVTVIGCIYGKNKEEAKRIQQRKDEIRKSYPMLVQKMALYLTTGMTIRNIWGEIYEEGLAKKGKNNPLYIEMGISVNELQNGVSEGMVYKRFGERSGVSEFVRFTALLSQNLKKGNSRLKELLNKEAIKAEEERKQMAIRDGEKAGTKLLFPMMILLLDVLLMVMVPAFWSI